jgi:hypothetical protein
MIVEDQLDRGACRIGGVEKLEEFDEFPAAMAILDQRMDLAGDEVDAGQQADGGVTGRLRRLAAARSLGAAIRVCVGGRGLPAGADGGRRRMHARADRRDARGKERAGRFQTGVRESAQSWRELLIDINQRGLEIAPDLAVGDGALGFWKAIEQVFPSTRHQRCWVHIAGRDPHFRRGGRSPPGQIPVSPVAWGQA